jgi:hypothetical protein
MLDSPEGICRGQAGSNIKLLPYPLVSPKQRRDSTARLPRCIPGLPPNHFYRGDDLRVGAADRRQPEGTIA